MDFIMKQDLKRDLKKFFTEKSISISLLLFIAILIVPAVRAAEFCDVTGNEWFAADVLEMNSLGYIKGYDDSTFRPDGAVTKAEFTAIVCRSVGKSAASSGGHWADGIINAALSAGWFDWDEIPPTGETYDDAITRELAAKIVMRALLPDATGDYNTVYNAVNDFSELDGRYYDSVFAAYCSGIMTGDDDGMLRPKDTLTRAQACAIIMRAVRASGNNNTYTETTAAPEVYTSISGGVSINGALSVGGTQLVNAYGEPVVLHGMSSHGMQWYSPSAEAIRSTAAYGANVFRCAMYTSEGGYLSDTSVKDKVTAAVDAASAADMYVIIDWHILSDGDPMTSIDAAAEFFDEMSQKYADNPSVIYEICNEPNGNVTWNDNVRPYAETIINVIRKNSSGIILVGSPTWSQDLHEAAKNPLDGYNIMYTCHFYAGTHTQWLRDRIKSCGLPVFVSEWGTSAADGNGGVFIDETTKWLDFMNENNISWVNWSLCDKAETSAALISGANVSDGIDYEELSESGKLVFSRF